MAEQTTKTNHSTLAKQREILKQEGLDALVAVSPENVGYTAGYMVPSQLIPIRKRQFYTIVTPSHAALIVVNVEYQEALVNSLIEVRAYNEFTHNPADVLAEALREFGVAKGRVGLELDFMPARYYLRLLKALPGLEVVEAEHIYDHMRMIKTEDEIKTIRRVARIVDETHAEVQRNAKPGMTEMEVAFMMIEGVMRRGCQEMRKLVIGTGERSVYANCPPTDRKLLPGDVLRVDVFATLNGYLSDIARTSVIGEATPEHRQIWKKLCDAQTLISETIRDGVTTQEVWTKFLDYFTRVDLNPAINFLGHSVGLTLHEEPFIDRYRNYTLKTNMILAIEPVFFLGNQGFHIEDYMLVTADGCEMLSDGRGDLPVIR